MQKLYTGRRDRDGLAVVHVIEADGDSHELKPRRDLREHSLSFEWGYDGSGPAQLALALLADALGNDYQAQNYYQPFKRMIVECMPILGWQLSVNEVCRAVVILAKGEQVHE
jgi:hypothetical protein